MSGPEAITKVSCRSLQGGSFLEATATLIVEKELKILLDETLLAVASLTPGMEREFVVGYLFTQGFIEGIDQVQSISISPQEAHVNLLVPAPRPEGLNYRIVSGGGRMAFAEARSPVIESGLSLKREVVFQAMEALFQGGKIYKQTRGAHCAGLFTPEGRAVSIVEDMGRHNCLDKIIGHALLKGIDLSSHFLASTGRMSSEMVAKLLRAGIPVVATKTAVTHRGVEMAKQANMTLVGFVRSAGMKIHTDMTVRVAERPSMKIYTRPERIL